jgi:hypothetical protein
VNDKLHSSSVTGARNGLRCCRSAVTFQPSTASATRILQSVWLLSLVQFGEGTRGDAVPLLRHLGPAELKGDICLLRRNKFYLLVVSVFL